MILRLGAVLPTVGALIALSGSTALANVTGNDSQNFNPVTGGSDFVTVQSSTVLNPGRFSLGLFMNQATNSLPYSSEEHQSRSKFNDSIVGMDLVIGAGVLPGLELGVALPFVTDQKVKDDDTRGEFAKNGNTEVKPVLKYAFLRRSNVGLALTASANVNRVQDDPHTGTGTSPIYNVELSGDTRTGRWTMGMNVGYRARRPGEKLEGSLIEPITSQAIASTAVAYAVTAKASVVTEIFGSRVLDDIANETDRQAASAEALLGLRYAFNKSLTGHIGGGTELMHGLATPDWRVYAGLATEVGPGGELGRTVVEKKKKKKKMADPVHGMGDYGATPPPPALAGMDDNGPGIEAIPAEEPDEIFVLHNINFEFDSDFRVLPGAVAELEKLNAHLQKKPYTKLVIEGHTDYFGTDEYNENLSQRRAQTVRRQLIKYYSVEPNDAIAVGYGESRPMTDDMSDQGRQLNRRVEIKIYRDQSIGH